MPNLKTDVQQSAGGAQYSVGLEECSFLVADHKPPPIVKPAASTVQRLNWLEEEKYHIKATLDMVPARCVVVTVYDYTDSY